MIKRLLKDCSGNFGILTAIVATCLCLVAGLAMDYSVAYLLHEKLQLNADAAALAAASQPQKTDDELAAIAKSYALGNGDTNVTADSIAVNVVRSADRSSVDVTVTLRETSETSLMRLADIKSIPVSVRSTAKGSLATGSPCVIALDPVSAASFHVQGMGSVSTPKCGIQINSKGVNDALVQQGGGFIEAKFISVSGGYLTSGTYRPRPKAHQPPVSDPLAALAEPDMPSICTYKDRSFRTLQNFTAGTVFCGNIDFNSDAKFQPGIYYFKDATVTTGANANIEGDGVMLYFGPGSALIQAAGTGSFSIKSMKSGVYKGIAIFGSRENAAINVFKMAGNKDFNIAGTIYLPTTVLTVYGNVDTNVTFKSGWIIAWRFLYIGNSALIIDSDDDYASPLLNANKVRLLQ